MEQTWRETNYGTIQNEEKTDGKDAKCVPEDESGPEKSVISIGLQLVIYGLAIALLVLIFVIPSPLIDPKGEGHHAEHIKQGRQMVMRNIIYGTLAAGCLAYLMQFLKQPLILGYLLGGVLVGPIGLRLIIDEHEIATMILGAESELGLIFLLFMIGLELNVEELVHLGRKICVSGLLQFPCCVTFHFLAFAALGMSGLPVDDSQLGLVYIADKDEAKTEAGQISIGILIFQDVWAIIVLAVQNHLDSPRVLAIGKTFTIMLAMVSTSFLYAKYVMPVLLESVTLPETWRLSLCWCFFVCAAALLPFVSVSMELAALIAGASLASFSYSKELVHQIRYIRDFFITLYFVSLGLQIPIPSSHVIFCAACVSMVVLLGRWLGIFCPIYFLGGDVRPALLSTVNLSQVSEFALVIGGIGYKQGHLPRETLTVLSWVFILLAVLSAPLMDHASVYQKASLTSGADGSVEETLSVPVGRIGHLIGKGGKNIQSLEELTGARLRVLKAENDDEEPEEQRLLVSGTPKAVDLAKQHLAKYIPSLPEVDPTASGVPERRKIADAAPAEERATGPDLHGQRSRAAEVLAAAGRGRKAVKEETGSRSRSMHEIVDFRFHDVRKRLLA
eukprot:s381_g24.t1